MRVLILTTAYKPHIGGSELAIENLTKRLPNVFFDIVTAGFGGKWLLPLTGFFKAFRRTYDVIHAWQASYAGGAGWLLKVFFPKIPFIVTLQEGKDLARQSFFVRLFRRVILRKADAITAISTYLLEYAKKINPKAKLYLLPNGVDPSMFYHTSSDYIFSSSRLVPKNGMDILIEAMKLLPNQKLKIAGGGPQLLQKLPNVEFLGPVPYEELPPLMAHASVFVRPSRSEGQGIAFLDAMAARVPIVAPPVGGIPDFLKDGETGLFCKLEDPQSVADAVTRLLTDEPLRDKIIRQAHEMVQEKYNWDILAQQYYEIIRHHSRL